MDRNLTCMQVSALINFYIEDKLNPRLKEYVEIHLAKCRVCRSKVDELKSLLIKYNELKTPSNNRAKEDADLNFAANLSAYVDNELEDDENIKIKKMTVSNPGARKELENLYKFKQILKLSFNKTKKDLKQDYSKIIVAILQDNEFYSTNYFYRIAVFCAFLVILLTFGLIYLHF